MSEANVATNQESTETERFDANAAEITAFLEREFKKIARSLTANKKAKKRP